NRHSGLAELVIPPRSPLVGTLVHAGMTVRDGDLIVLGVQRQGEELGPEPVPLRVGDHVLLQGTWRALEKHLASPQVLVVNSPELVRRQAVPLSLGAKEALGILALLILLLVTGWVPAALAAVICAFLVVLSGVLTLPQAYKGIDWSTCILVGATIPIATAMTQTGAAVLVADTLIAWLGDLGPRAVLGGIFVATVAITSVISNTAATLLMLPIAIAAAGEIGVSAMPFIIATAMGAHAALLTPVATPVNLMLLGPGAYRFTDYTKIGVPIALWWLLVVLFVVPLYWQFSAMPQ
ncbi:MAG: SLC13 family permease, partial [Pseudomonadota bacterium]